MKVTANSKLRNCSHDERHETKPVGRRSRSREPRPRQSPSSGFSKIDPPQNRKTPGEMTAIRSRDIPVAPPRKSESTMRGAPSLYFCPRATFSLLPSIPARPNCATTCCAIALGSHSVGKRTGSSPSMPCAAWTHPSPSPPGRPNSLNLSRRNCAAVSPPSRKSKPRWLATFLPNPQNKEDLMTDALETRRVSPAYPSKSGCGVPPQAVLEASRRQSSAPKLTISRLNRIQGVWESRPHLFLFPKHHPSKLATLS